MVDQKKFLDYEGVKHLWSKVNMQDYPNNETLMAVINAIDETKADKKDLYHNVLIENYILPAGESTIVGCFPSFQISSKYCVIFDNVIYDNLIGEYWEDEYHGIGAIWGNYSNYPFGFVNQCDDLIGNNISCYIEDTSVEHTISIYSITDNFLYRKEDFVLNQKMIDTGTSWTITFNTQALKNWLDRGNNRFIYCCLNDGPLQPIIYDNEQEVWLYNYNGNIISLNMRLYYPSTLSIVDNYADFVEAPIITLGYIQCISDLFIPDTIARTSDIITPVQSDWNENDEVALNYIKNRPFYEVPEAWTQISFVENDKSSTTTGKLGLTSYAWTEDRVYRVRVDGIEYTFDGMTQTSTLNAWGSVVYYIGAFYIPLNSNMNWSEYSFCFCTADFTNIYAVFEDGTTNHTVEFFESEGEIHKIDIKYLPIATDDEILEMLAQEDMLPVVTDSDGSLLTNENNNILLW